VTQPAGVKAVGGQAWRLEDGGAAAPVTRVAVARIVEPLAHRRAERAIIDEGAARRWSVTLVVESIGDARVGGTHLAGLLLSRRALSFAFCEPEAIL